MAKRNKTNAVVPTPNEGENKIVRANVNRQMVSSDQFVSIYANDTQIQTSPWDFRFVFGVISSVPTTEDPTIVVRQIGEVRMSPEHAKRIAKVLVQQVVNYERNVGPIPQPEE